MRRGVIAVFMALSLVGCATAKPPIVIEKKCYMAELAEKPKLPAVEFIGPLEGCSHFRCLDIEGGERLKQREILLRGDSNYVRRVYEDARKRCSQ